MKPACLVSVVVLLPVLAAAQSNTSYYCALDDMVRRIEIVSEPGVSVPCEVHYYQDAGQVDQRQVLWRALHEEGYCERKTAEFVEELKATGWDCGGESASPAGTGIETESDADETAGQNVDNGDDTGNLAPGADDVPEEPRS